jgi:hypothetical protein
VNFSHILKFGILGCDSKGKKKEGLGIKNLRKVNVSLICMWWWILENEEGLWQDIVKLKYVKNKSICHILNRQNDSSAWKDFMKIRHIYIKGREFKVKNGKLISFWLDHWMDKSPLCIVYPVLYDLALHKDVSVFDVYSNEWVIQFKVRLPPLIKDQWYDLAAKLNNVGSVD